MNAIIHKASEAAISSFVKKAKAYKKSKVEYKMNHIEEELYDLSLTVYVISTINFMEDIHDDAWNIGLEYNKYGSRLAKSSCIDTYCIFLNRTRRSIKNTKELVGN